MLKRRLVALGLVGIVVLSLACSGWLVYRQSPAPARRVTSSDDVGFEGRSRRSCSRRHPGRSATADHGRPVRAVPAPVERKERDGHRVPSQFHPLLGRPAPPFELLDSLGKTWTPHQECGPEFVVLVFYLGQSCMACVTHLVELEFASSQFKSRGVRILAISADSPEASRQRLNRFGDFRVPLLADTDHATAQAYGVWKPLPVPTRTTARLCTVRSSSTVTASSVGRMSAIARSGMSSAGDRTGSAGEFARLLTLIC